MNKLLSAGFARLRKNHVFWFGIVFMMLTGIYTSLMSYAKMKETGYSCTLENGFFNYAVYIGIVSSVFCGLFIGTEYSDGAMRNKIVIGHTRGSIYLSNYIVCAAAGLCLCLANMIPYLCIGVPLLGSFETDVKKMILLVLCTFFMTLALSAIYTVIAMLNQNKAVVASVCILSAFLLLFAGSYINSRLTEPETYPAYITLVNGEFVEEDDIPNPNYLRGTKREVYEFLYDFIPGGQAIQYVCLEAENPQLLMLYSGIIVIAATGLGLFFFRKKDLK